MREPRQLNVQQQNAKTLRSIRSTAEYWRGNTLPELLLQAALLKRIDLSQAIIIDLAIDELGIDGIFGTLLTQNERFIELEIDCVNSAVQIYRWLDVTNPQNLEKHNKGIGVGAGALAIQVLHELNR